MKKVLVGMSGGVDSSVSAALLMEAGYSVTGVFVEAYNESGCRTDQDKKDALQVALKLGIPFSVLDLRQEYKRLVVEYFFNEYQAGRTPNPDIVCNSQVKFGLLYDYMLKQGFDYLATGHYARVVSGSGGGETGAEFYLQQAVDESKDQSYFLWQVAREKLGKVLWPLGELEKSWVRQKAVELGLPNAEKPDSMGVCMIGELNVHDFLKAKLGTKPGRVEWGGREVGEHEGLWFYTIGARGGWKIRPGMQSATMPPLYVVGKRREENVLEVSERKECEAREIVVERATLWKTGTSEQLSVRIRNLGELTPVQRIEECGEGRLRVGVERAIFAPAPGQSAVFYDLKGVVVGGGIIAESENSVYL